MAENRDGQERTEQATPKRKEQARRKGQVARSKELTTMTMMVVAALTMLSLGGSMISGLVEMTRRSLTVDRKWLFDPDGVTIFLSQAAGDAIAVATPFFIVMVITAFASSIALGGFSFSTEAIAFKLDKLNPVTGLKRIFAWRGLMELVKALAKFLLIGGVAITILIHFADQFLILGFLTPKSALNQAGEILSWAFLGITSSLVLIAAFDIPFQLWDHQRQLKMTKQEVKDERKEYEGKPEVKGRIRNLQREQAMRRMMAEVPKADVVVTNPTHFAVALRYEPGEMKAPKVVAKGADLVAAKIREIAVHSEVQILQAPTLARALYYSAELDEEIPEGLYLAVAQVLAYVYQVRSAEAANEKPPSPPSDLPVPEDLYVNSKGVRH